MDTQITVPLDVIRVGTSVVLIYLNTGAKDFGISAEDFREVLCQLQIPLVSIGKREYYNLFALEKVLFESLRPGEKGWDFKTGPRILPKETSEFQLLVEMGVASMTYSTATAENLRAKVRAMADWMKKMGRRKKNVASVNLSP